MAKKQERYSLEHEPGAEALIGLTSLRPRPRRRRGILRRGLRWPGRRRRAQDHAA
jgi:hypothetical protein